jgi:hypothetical protein
VARARPDLDRDSVIDILETMRRGCVRAGMTLRSVGMRRDIMASEGGGHKGPRMLHLMGPARTKQAVILADQRISAAEAYEWGLVEEVADPGKAFDAAMTLAAKVAAQPPLSVAMTKLTVNRLAHALDDLASHMDVDGKPDRRSQGRRRGIPGTAQGTLQGMVEAGSPCARRARIMCGPGPLLEPPPAGAPR